MVEEVLIIGTPIHSYTKSVSDAFNRHNIQAKYLIYEKPNRYLKNIPIISRLYFFMYTKIYSIKYYKYCLKKCSDNSLIVLFGISYFSNKQLQSIRRLKRCTILSWFIDSIHTHIYFKRNIELSDYILCYNKSESDQLAREGKKAVFFPMAYDETLYYPIHDAVKEYDIYFIGTLSKRMDFLDELIKRLDHLNLRIRIDGPVSWIRRAKLRRNYPHLNRYLSGNGASHGIINVNYNKSFICLGLQPVQADTGLSTRTFEICGAGALQLTNGNREVLNNLLQIDNEILHYNNIDELIQSIEYLHLHRESESLREIAFRGYKKVLNDHTFSVRITQLISYIKENKV